MAATLPLFGAFLLGLGTRRWLQRHINLLFRLQLAGGVGVLAVLAGWSFELNVRNLGAVGALLVAQLTAVGTAAWGFRRRTDGPLIAFWMYGNPTFWSLPVATALLGSGAAVFIVAYDMLTQFRIALAIRLLRTRAPWPQSSRTAFVDYAPTAGAVCGLLFGLVVPAPDAIATVVASLGIVMAFVGALLVGVAWPRHWTGRPYAALAARALALHLTVVPTVLGLFTLAGLDLPGCVWILALGPVPLSVVSFSQVYGYSPRTAATGLALSMGTALVLLPVAATLAG